MDWLRPAIASMCLSATLLSGTFFYVWHSFIRRRFVLLWSFAWLAAVPHLLITWALLDVKATHALLTSQQLFLILNAFLMVGGCYEFVHRRLPVRGLIAFSSPFVLWAAFGPALTDRFFEFTLPNALLLGGSYIWTGTRFLILRRERGTRGALLLAVLFFAAGAHEFDFPLLGNLPWAAPAGYSLASLLAISISLCLLIMILEESRMEAYRERARVRGILDSLPVGVMVATPDGDLLLANGVARGMFGDLPGPRLQKIGSREAEIFLNPDGTPCDPAQLPIARALSSREATPAREFALVAPDGTKRATLVNAGPVQDEKGMPLGIVAVFQDIEELKRIQAEMLRTERLQGLGTLAAGVAHDFNNALTLIMGHADLASKMARDPVLRGQIDVIQRVASDSATIVRRMQDLARTRATRDNVIFDLAAVVDEAIDMTRPRWRDEAQVRGVRYGIRRDIELGATIAGQPAELREAVFNLVLNALDAMPQGGLLRFSVARREGEAVISVGDTGVGMRPEVRERVFDPFFTTKGARGTGLGLAVVFGIVQRHDGKISVESDLGRGTTFNLRFPLRGTTQAPPPAEARLQPPAKQRILVVDDQAEVRLLTQALLEAVGHDVATAESGAEALLCVGEREFDLVLTDLGMPAMNGWELAAGIHRLRPHLPVVLVTGWGETASPEEVIRNGVTAVLSKPFTLSQIVACVNQAAVAAAAP